MKMKLMLALFAIALIQSPFAKTMEDKPAVAMNNAMKSTLESKLHNAVKCDDLKKAAKYIAQLGYCWTDLLDLAIRNRSINMVRLLIDNGVNVHKQHMEIDPYTCPMTQKGFTPLMLAACANETEICKLLLNKNVDVNAKRHSGATALTYAERNKNQELIDLLIENGAERPKKKDCCPNSCSIQ